MLELSTPECEVDEGEVIRRVLAGEQELFQVLVAKYQETVFRMLYRQTGEGAISRDLCQETFLAAYRALGGFKGEAKFSTWLIRIALNISKNYFRSKQYRERRASLELAKEPVAESEAEPDIEERLYLLREFIAELRPIYRDVIVLCGLERKSYEEASLILGVPIGTVRSRLNSARLFLRECFGRAKGGSR